MLPSHGVCREEADRRKKERGALSQAAGICLPLCFGLVPESAFLFLPCRWTLRYDSALSHASVAVHWQTAASLPTPGTLAHLLLFGGCKFSLALSCNKLRISK